MSGSVSLVNFPPSSPSLPLAKRIISHLLSTIYCFSSELSLLLSYLAAGIIKFMNSLIEAVLCLYIFVGTSLCSMVLPPAPTCHSLLFGRVLCHGTNPHSREWKGQPLPIHTLTHWHNTHARSHFGGQTYDSPFLSVLIRSGAIAPAAIILSDPILQLRLLTPPLTHSP